MGTSSAEKYGVLMKEEVIRCLDDQGIEGTMVLETPEPFPGFAEYYSETPGSLIPQFIYCGVEENMHFDDFARVEESVRQSTGIDFQAAFATISAKYDIIKVLRLRGLKSYDQILPVQQAFANAGIQFRKKLNLKESVKALIRLKKMFAITDLGDGLYLDDEDGRSGYFIVPQKIEWPNFVDLVAKVKNNWNQVNYDVAIGYLYNYNGISDVIRVYSNNVDKEFLELARSKFLARL